MKYQIILPTYLLIVLLCSACSGLLDEKTDIKMVIPKSLDDAELLLNDYTTMNMGYPALGEMGADQYYIPDETFDGTLNTDQQGFYTWTDQPYTDVTVWQRPYKAVFNANQVLDMLAQLPEGGDLAKKSRLLGAAHFFRAFAFQQLIEVFAPAYQKGKAATDLGIPLRLNPGVDEPSRRASLEDSYQQVLKDYNIAARNLPDGEAIIGQPLRASAYAGLARAYLAMSDFEQAYLYADSSLMLRGDLLDFNELDKEEDLPIPRFNKEILFIAMTGGSGPMNYNNNIVKEAFYNSYEVFDLRKRIFFQERDEPIGTQRYRGNYDRNKALLFVGLTTSEMYLTKTESAVRTDRVDEALSTLNTLLLKRFRTGKYVPITERDPDDLLALILKEREKELIFRGRGWSDLKRLNLDSRFQKTLSRTVKGRSYTLLPNSLQYAFRLPEAVVRVGGLPQNPR
ncbi:MULTISPECIES: RagB/SusD family nutrient uptake outer membrane protein [Sphingobacterium]|uniref:RagB/SusD family nutrient uptake outer membrane protein n=1 Tax=Sphingobacterium TaxID=28453 RepID=UPI0013D944C6|nr:MULTISPECIES: RagB/SusD family nutrient uptake outer membrane protein [unclassified Sphingobacterium]